MKISNNVLERIEESIKALMESYQQEMEVAYLALGDDALDIKFGVKIKEDNARVKLTTSISFIKDRCRDTSTSWVDDEQTNLFDQEGGTNGV